MTHLSSPIEEIQAAIDKLTELTAATTTGPWIGWRKYDPLRGTLFGIEARETDVAKTYTPQDAELIELLHATIEPQLQILTKALADEEKAAKHTWFNAGQLTRAGLLLARAINGGA